MLFLEYDIIPLIPGINTPACPALQISWGKTLDHAAGPLVTLYKILLENILDYLETLLHVLCCLYPSNPLHLEAAV